MKITQQQLKQLIREELEDKPQSGEGETEPDASTWEEFVRTLKSLPLRHLEWVAGFLTDHGLNPAAAEYGDVDPVAQPPAPGQWAVEGQPGAQAAEPLRVRERVRDKHESLNVTKQRLKQIIREELEGILNEEGPPAVVDTRVTTRSAARAPDKRTVMRAQAALGITRDGVYDKLMQKAVMNFQRDIGLDPDGMLNDQTLSALMGK